MATGNVRNLEILGKVNKLAGHIVTGIQIIFTVLIAICCFYVALKIFESHLLDFLNPFMASLREFVVFLFGNNIKSNDEAVDGHIVLFILLSIVVVFFMVQLRIASKTYAGIIEKKIIDEKLLQEKVMNAQLASSLQDDIKAQSQYLFVVEIRNKYLLNETMGYEVPSAEEVNKVRLEIIAKFYESMKQLSNLKFSKDNDILLMSSGNIDKIDVTLNKIWDTIDALKAEYKPKKYVIKAKIGVEAYRQMTSVNKAYRSAKMLLGLNNANYEVLCFGNFKNRYELISNHQYAIGVKGKYDLAENAEETIYSIVKKD